MEALRDLEITHRAFVIYGIFDKPARSLIMHFQASTAKNGCPFCLTETKRESKKVFFCKDLIFNSRSDQLFIKNSIEAENSAPFRGHKGISALR